MSHTPTPWATNGTRVESEKEHRWANDGWIICDCMGSDAEANVRRIVACVNACEGVSTERLENNYGQGYSAHDEVKDLRQQRDNLKASLNAIAKIIKNRPIIS